MEMFTIFESVVAIMRSIRYVFFALMGTIFVLGIAIIATSWRTQTINNALHQLMQDIQIKTALIDEFETFIDLENRYAKNYAATTNNRWRSLHDHAKSIRAGYFLPPSENLFDYWAQLEDPNHQLNLPEKTSIQKYPTIIGRLQNAGVTDSQLAPLNQVKETIEKVRDVQQQSIYLVHGKKLTPRGIERVIPDPALALQMLNAPTYTFQLAQIMRSIGAFSDYVSNDDKTLLAEYQYQKVLLDNVTFFMAILLVISLLTTTILLWRGFLKPLELMRKTIIGQVEKKQFEFKLDIKHQGELKDLAIAQNEVLSEIADQFEFNRRIKAFSDFIRGCDTSHQLAEQTANFLIRNLNLPYAALYLKRQNKITFVGGIGHDESIEEMETECQTYHATVMKTQSPLRVCGERKKFQLRLPTLSFDIEEMHFFPLSVNNEAVGILELGAVEKLTETQYEWLDAVLEDLAVNLQLTSNNELQVETERKVSEQLKLNQQILNAIPNPTYFRDAAGCYIGVNDAFYDFVNKKEEDVIDHTPVDIFADEAGLVFEAEEDKLMLNPGSTIYEIELTNAEGENCMMMVHEATYYDTFGAPSGIVGLFVDITKQKRLEKDLITAKNMATEASKTKGEFLANMSHEIRTPMNAILGMSHLVLQTELAPQQKNYVQQIETSGNNLLHIINDILDVSKIESGKMTIENITFSFNDVIDNLSRLMAMKIKEKQLELVLDISPDIADYYLGDPLRLGQVLINLVGNAIKFTQEGEIVVSIYPLSETESDIELQFDVKDTGIGMSEKQLSHLFQAFSQADTSVTRNYGGTGLGLTISKQLIELMQGNISVQSEPNKGSCFSFTVTLGRSEQGKTINFTSMKELKGKRVLVVDDNQTTLDIFAELLKGMQIKSKVVTNGFLALEEIRMADQQNTPFDLVILDWNMPNLLGDETAKRIKELPITVQPKMILASAYGDDPNLNQEEIEKLFSAKLTKPIAPSYLVDALLNTFGPMVKSFHPEKNHNNTNKHAFDFQKANILIVEDNMVNQEVALGIIEPFNAELDIAENGLVALEKVKTHQFDLILMDMQMPIMDGVTATKEIRKLPNSKNIPIIAMTANAMEPDIRKCLVAGMNGHITKPVDPNVLLKTIEHWLNHQRNGDIEHHLQSSQVGVGLNTEEGIARMNGNEELYWKIVKTYIQSRDTELCDMRDAFSKKDNEKLRRLAHACKGASANISANGIMKLAALLEKNPTESPLKLIDQIAKGLKIITIQYQENQTDLSPSPTKKPINNDEEDKALRHLTQLKNFLPRIDDATLNKVRHSNYLQQHFADNLQTLITLLDEFEFGQAENEIDCMIQQSKDIRNQGKLVS